MDIRCQWLFFASVFLFSSPCAHSWFMEGVFQRATDSSQGTLTWVKTAFACTRNRAISVYQSIVGITPSAPQDAFEGIFSKICSQVQESSNGTECAAQEKPSAPRKLPSFMECVNGAPGKGSPMSNQQPKDCSEVLANGDQESGVYPIWLEVKGSGKKRVEVFCDMETDGGGWTLIQRRGEYSEQEDFNRDWDTYKKGFGNLTKEFWLGNDNIYALSNQESYALRFDLENKDGDKGFSVYQPFWIEDETAQYEIHLEYDYGNTGDSMMLLNNGMGFTAKDRGNDGSPNGTVSNLYSKGGWWYRLSGNDFGTLANLNGVHVKKFYAPDAQSYIYWFTWTGIRNSLRGVEMKLKPTNLIPKY